MKPFLCDVVAQAEDERGVDLVEVAERGSTPGRRRADSTTSSSSANCARAGEHRAVGVDDDAEPSKTSSSWPPTRLQSAIGTP